MRQCPDVIKIYVITALIKRPRLSSQHEVLSGANASTERNPFLHEVGSILIGTARADEIEGICLLYTSDAADE